MADFPTDVITNILSRLPLKSLLEFRSTSKSWRSLIDSNHFKTLHLHKLNSNLNLILCHNSELYSVDFPTLGTVNLNQPLKSYENDITIIGSCNGLICIKNFVDDIAILNPYLRKHWVLPYLSTCGIDDFVYGVGFGFGFGFDSFTGDYKLVKISYIESNVNLFSCKTNAWKTLPNMPYALSWKFTTNGVFVDHALHWSVVNLNCNMTNTRLIRLIVAFDLRFEVFNEVPLPKLGEGFEIEVSHLGGDLSMVVNYQSTRIDIWVMKQYGSKDSWFKLFTLFESLVLRSLKFVKPLGYSNDGMKVLFEQDVNKLIWYNFKNIQHPNSRLFWYNLENKQVSHVTNPRMPYFDEAMIWMGTLVQPPFPSEMQK